MWGQKVIVKCNRCGHEVPAEDSYQHLGETLCEDCYINIRYPVKACDPWAVYSATRSRGSAGFKGTEGLTELQKAIYGFIRGKGKATWEELVENFELTDTDLRREWAILRHCELIKGHKEDNSVYLVPFDYSE